MANWTDWMDVLGSGGEYYDSIHEIETTSSGTHTFSSSLNLAAGKYNIIVNLTRRYWYDGETCEVTVTNGTYTLVQEYSNIPAYGGHKTQLLEVEMNETGSITVTGVGQREMYITIIAYTASGDSRTSNTNGIISIDTEDEYYGFTFSEKVPDTLKIKVINGTYNHTFEWDGTSLTYDGTTDLTSIVTVTEKTIRFPATKTPLGGFWGQMIVTFNTESGDGTVLNNNYEIGEFKLPLNNETKKNLIRLQTKRSVSDLFI